MKKSKIVANIMQIAGIFSVSFVVAKYVPLAVKNIPAILLVCFGVGIAMVGAFLEGYNDVNE